MRVTKMKLFIRTMFWTVISIYSFTSCSSVLVKVEPSDELDLYRKHLVEFTDGKLGTSNTVLGFNAGKKPSNIMGSCRGFNFNYFGPSIDINKDKWYDLSILRAFILIAHEYRHCECRGDVANHIEGTFSDGCESHYMNSYLVSQQCAERHKKVYLEQIKKGCEG